MNWVTIKSNWSGLKDEAQKRWEWLTDEDWETMDGSKEKLVSKVQEHYGLAKDAAARRVDQHFKAVPTSHE